MPAVICSNIINYRISKRISPRGVSARDVIECVNRCRVSSPVYPNTNTHAFNVNSMKRTQGSLVITCFGYLKHRTYGKIANSAKPTALPSRSISLLLDCRFQIKIIQCASIDGFGIALTNFRFTIWFALLRVSQFYITKQKQCR